MCVCARARESVVPTDGTAKWCTLVGCVARSVCACVCFCVCLLRSRGL